METPIHINHLKRTGSFFKYLFFSTLTIISIFSLNFIIFISTAPANNRQEPVVFTIEKGDSLSKTTNQLFDAELIRNRFLFKLFVRLSGYGKQVKSGEYEISKNLKPVEVMNIIKSGKSIEDMVTIPEGLSLAMIESTFNEKGFPLHHELATLSTNRHFLKSLHIKADSLEGYLFPDTYSFPKDIKTKEIARVMVKRFWEIFSEELRARAKELGMTVHEVVTLASIVEKETGSSGEMKTVSGVFHNRLKKRMRLQSDPTTIYGIENFDGNLKKRDLRTSTPYNTYKIKGLPPGPIASPGKNAIIAALYPEQHSYLYFVSKNNGTHHFSKSLKEHNRAVHRYQLR